MSDDLTYAEQRAFDAVQRCAAELRRAVLGARAAGLEVVISLDADGVTAKVRRAEPPKKKPAFGGSTP